MATVDDKVVTFRLAAARLPDRILKLGLRCARPKHRAQIRGVLLAETHEQRARASEPHAIAAFAEIMGHRGDEPDPLTRFRDLHIPRRAAGPVIRILERP